MWENGQPHLHLGVHVAVDGRQPVDGWQAAAPSGAGMEHSFLVFIECGQMRVVSRHLQLVSAEHTRTVSGSTQNNCQSPPRDALRRSAPGRSLQVVFVQNAHTGPETPRQHHVKCSERTVRVKCRFSWASYAADHMCFSERCLLWEERTWEATHVLPTAALLCVECECACVWCW